MVGIIPNTVNEYIAKTKKYKIIHNTVCTKDSNVKALTIKNTTPIATGINVSCGCVLPQKTITKVKIIEANTVFIKYSQKTIGVIFEDK